MLDRGCKDFVFLSRSGTTKPEAAGVVAHLEQAGAKVEVCSVDATNEEVVADVIKRVSFTRPIRGVIHAAMVIQVRRHLISKDCHKSQH
jgi:menaquinone-dependent protoporphyrinogen IX oxidase